MQQTIAAKMGTDVRNIRIASFRKDGTPMPAKLRNLMNRILEDEDDDEDDFYKIELQLDADESQSSEDLKSNAAKLRESINGGMLVFDNSVMVAEDVPVSVITVPKTSQTVSSTESSANGSNTKKDYQWQPNQDETEVGSLQGSNESATEEVETKRNKKTAAVVVSIVTVVLVLAGATAFYLIRKAKNLKRSSISAIPHMDTHPDQSTSQQKLPQGSTVFSPTNAPSNIVFDKSNNSPINTKI